MEGLIWSVGNWQTRVAGVNDLGLLKAAMGVGEGVLCEEGI